jgi:hypothetical protein
LNMGTVRAMLNTVKIACKTTYMSARLLSPIRPHKRHHILLAREAFRESSLFGTHPQPNGSHRVKDISWSLVSFLGTWPSHTFCMRFSCSVMISRQGNQNKHIKECKVLEIILVGGHHFRVPENSLVPQHIHNKIVDHLPHTVHEQWDNK